MAATRCPKCGGTGMEGEYLTSLDTMPARMSTFRNAMGHRPSPTNPQLALARLALWGISFTAKKLFAKTFKCKKCHHVWRKWF